VNKKISILGITTAILAIAFIKFNKLKGGADG